MTQADVVDSKRNADLRIYSRVPHGISNPSPVASRIEGHIVFPCQVFFKVAAVVHLEGLVAQGVHNTVNVECRTCVLLTAEDDHHKKMHHSPSCFRRT
jgi:hypothetical protein